MRVRVNRLRSERPRATARRPSLGSTAWLTAWLSLTLGAAAPGGGRDASEREALPPGDIVDLVALALSKTRVRAYTEESFSLLADFGPADANELRSELGLSVAVPLSSAFSLRASAVGRGWFYGYDGDRSELAADLGGGSLFEQLYGAEIGLGGVYQLSPRWSVFGEGRGKLSWEQGAHVADAAKGSGTLGVGFELDSRLSLALGVEVGSRLDAGGVRVQPVFGFRWRIRDGMRLESNGIGLLFGLDLRPELELQLRARFESDTHLLDDRGAALGAPTLRQHRVPLIVALRWTPTPHWRLAAGAGSVVYQQWQVEAEQGGQKNTVDAGPAALGWLKIEYRF